MSLKGNKFFKNFTSILVKDRPLAGHTSSSTEVISVAINGTGTRLVASRTDKSLRIWKCVMDRVVDPIVIEDAHTRSVERISWNPKTENSFATVGRDEYIKIWKGTTGKLEHRIKVEKGLGQNEPTSLKVVSYSTDGETILVVDRDSTVLLYGAGHTKIAEFQVDGHIYDVQWFNHTHNYFLVTLGDGTVPVYRVNGASAHVEKLASLEGHRSAVTTASVDPRGTYLALGSNEGTISLWNTASMLNYRVIGGVDEAIACVEASRDGAYIAASYDRGSNIRLFDVGTGEEVYEVQNSVSGQSTFASVVWFPNKTAFVHTSDHGTTLTVAKKPERT